MLSYRVMPGILEELALAARLPIAHRRVFCACAASHCYATTRSPRPRHCVLIAEVMSPRSVTTGQTDKPTEFTALVMVAEIGDISRLGTARKLAARAGQTPTVQGSDLKVRHGHISKQGPAWLRWAMNQAAQAGMPPLMAADRGNFWRPTVKL